MKNIEFKYSPNILLNSGIIALYIYLKKFKEETEIEYSFNLSENSLIVESEELFNLLDDVYYFMGTEIYDIQKKDGNKKYYFIENPFQAVEFRTMNSYGLAGFITKPPLGPQPVSRKKSNSTTFKKLAESDKDFAYKIAQFYFEQKFKLKKFDITENGYKENKEQNKGDSKIFLNEPYTKTTYLEKPKLDYFTKGNKTCFLTGQSFEALVDSQSTSPFISGLINFNSFFHNNSDKKISWQAMYLLRFSPKLCLYKYSNPIYESLSIYFFSSTNLKKLLDLFEINKSFYKTSIELEKSNYLENYNLFEIKDYFTEQYENLFAIIYTFYLQFLKTQKLDIKKEKNLDDPFAQSKFENIPISLVSIRAKQFSKTMRPDTFDEINNFKFIIRVIHYLETKGIKFDIILYNLKIISVAQKNSKNHSRIERQLRNKIFEKFIRSKSILTEIEWLFFQSFKYLFDKNYYENRNYNALVDFVKYYEQVINYGGNKSMNSNLQEKAINLGTSIGIGILLFENEERKHDKKKENIKKARKYIIGIRKAGNFEKFADALIRIQERFLLSVSKELLQQINNDNFSYIQKFVIISMLNQVNPIIRNQKEKKQESTKE